jgi:hypothetical protein
MRRTRLLFPALLLTGFLSSQCSLFDSENSDDDDDDGGDGGESGESMKGGASGGAGRASTGGTGSSGKGGAGTGGSGTGGNDGGTTSVGGSATGGSSTGGDGNTGALGGTDPGAGGDASSGGTGGGVESGGTGGALGGTGGAGGGGVSGGAGGAGGSAGTGGSAGGLSCGIGEGFELPIEPGEDSQSGWIDASSNCVGIQGALYPIVDVIGSTMTITDTEGRICVTGTSKRVVGGDFTTYWGARLVIQLNNDGAATALPYDAIAQGVEGFKFTLSGAVMPAEIRPTLFNTASDTQYCKRICASGAQSILITEATVDCWDGESAVTPAGTSLERLEFSVPSSASADVPFDFCIEGFTAILDDTTVGDPGSCVGNTDTCENACGFATETCLCDSSCLQDLTGCCPDFEAVCLN